MEDQRLNQISHSIDATEIDLEMNLSTIRTGTGETIGPPLVLHRLKGVHIHKNSSYCQSRSNQLNNSAFRRSDNRSTTGFTPYEQKIPQNKIQLSSNVVRFTTTDDTNNDLSDLCPLNY